MSRIPQTPPTLTQMRVKWYNSLTFLFETFYQLYTRIIMFNTLMNEFIGAGPKAGQRFLQNAVTAEEERSKDLSEGCQILHRREYEWYAFYSNYRHALYEETVLFSCELSLWINSIWVRQRWATVHFKKVRETHVPEGLWEESHPGERRVRNHLFINHKSFGHNEWSNSCFKAETVEA